MKEIIIVHGKPTEERYNNPELPKPHEANWLPWVQSRLAQKGIKASLPAMPKPYLPVYADWKKEFEKYVPEGKLGLVGHSAGAEFVLRWLSENPGVELENLCLVAPWQDDKAKYGEFSHYDLDGSIPNRVRGHTTIYNSTDDSEAIQKRAKYLLDAMPGANLKQFSDYGHFMLGNNMVSEEFDALLVELSTD